MSKKLSQFFIIFRRLNLSSKMSADLSDMRKPYCDKSEALTDENILSDPFELFHIWFEKAKQNAGKHTEINAVCLSTSYQNKPSSRMVLLKGYDPDQGFRIFTNYESRKGFEIEHNSNVALLFYWEYPQRQIRIEGQAHKVSESISDQYFNARPKLSRISAIVSQQSQKIDSRKTLVKRQEEEEKKWTNCEIIPRPNFWGGYHIIPERFEFWQGQSDRLHDRFIFEKSDQKSWFHYRIQP
ncbi:pyridoxine/pyridoxamine 5'-phosphate oxidase-like [Dermatophagoides pteronyssinus]|uniref:pyridoxine/pyridoxamine 5'-phosphate oxidase-like n=1 Tax=Dermatophagoides pteronyssinus TaxID=6956 RepID=UPI003F6648D8